MGVEVVADGKPIRLAGFEFDFDFGSKFEFDLATIFSLSPHSLLSLAVNGIE